MSARTTEERLESARRRQAKADAAWGRTAAPTDDPGALSGIKGYNDTEARVSRNISRTVKAAREGVAAHEEVARLEHKLSREQKDADIRAFATMQIPLDEVQPGDVIRYENRNSPRNVGRVIRVNAKTLTIDAAPGYDKPKIDKVKVIETRRPQL